jgi:hypothetical protein
MPKVDAELAMAANLLDTQQAFVTLRSIKFVMQPMVENVRRLCSMGNDGFAGAVG